MAVRLEQFVKQLEDSGILAGETLKDFLPPKSEPKDAEDLARELVRQKKLTRFQAEEVYKGKGKSLTLGNYVLMEKIGAGGMGQVFKARHQRMDRIVAVKLLPTAMTKDRAAIARFDREVKAAAKISHANIVTAFDADQANGIHFLVMECVEGSDLSALVKKNGPFPVDKAINYVLQAARGLEAAHAGGVVHRDIKPANLLLDKMGVVKVLDMGLARLDGVGEGSPRADLTSTGTIMGTVDYMAPEQALDTKTADARADIYALGCSLYYLMTGKATYDGDTLMKKLLAHREQAIPSLRDARPEVPEPVEAVFRRMLAKKVEDRYQTMTEVIADMEQCLPRQESSVHTQQSFGSSSDTGLSNFLKDVSISPKKPPKPVPPKPEKAPLADLLLNKDWLNKNKKPLLIGTGVLGVLVVLMGVIISLRTKDGTLIVKINEPDAEVQVLSEEGVVEVTEKGGKGRVTISVDPGKHQLRVQKDGFVLFTKEFEMESDGKQTIAARLIPLEEKAASTAATSKPLAFQMPGFGQWVKEVAAMPAEKQVEAVSKKLMELNPGFDGKVTPTIQQGVVTAVQFGSEFVSDISPVRAFSRLASLHCEYTKVVDLTPLKGMPLINLRLGATQVSDLSPLTGMPLTALTLPAAVSDLSPLKDMKLTSLECYGTQVADFSPLKGMPLAILHCHNNLNITDLSPLKGMPLKNLACDFIPERDTDLLRSIKTLEHINGKTAAEFWKSVEEQQQGKTPGFQIPGFDQWIKQVAAMPAEQQAEAVSKNLMESNPGFDGKVTPTIENGVLTGLRFVADNVTDVSPVRALVGLTALNCVASSPDQGKLVDLSPLEGMPLTTLNVSGASVADLSPLVGMPLTDLNVSATRVTELSPLAGMPLTVLHFFGVDVTDISPLQGMKLTFLHCGGTKISDLSPLEGMPLTYLAIYGTEVSDLSPLKGMKLTFLQFNATKISALTPLAGMPLTTLNFQDTDVADISALKGMNLTQLQCARTEVADLSPLKGMPLAGLEIYATQVSDLSPLVGLPLEGLNVAGIRVTDLSPLKDLPLKNLICDFKPERDTELLRSIKTLETINGKPAAEFWKEVEAQHPATNTSDNVPPAGFKALFNGQDLTGWKGLIPINVRSEVTPEELARRQTEANDKFLPHWTVRDGVLHYDGMGQSLQTEQDFTNCELLVDWKIGQGGDSGIYLRGSPQVQIWDNPEGSGGLFNNQKNPRNPLQVADKPVGEWNTFRIIMAGEQVTVYLNNVLVADNVTMENHWDRSKPIYSAGPIELQHHASSLEFKNIFIKELP